MIKNIKTVVLSALLVSSTTFPVYAGISGLFGGSSDSGTSSYGTGSTSSASSGGSFASEIDADSKLYESDLQAVLASHCQKDDKACLMRLSIIPNYEFTSCHEGVCSDYPRYKGVSVTPQQVRDGIHTQSSALVGSNIETASKLFITQGASGGRNTSRQLSNVTKKYAEKSGANALCDNINDVPDILKTITSDKVDEITGLDNFIKNYGGVKELKSTTSKETKTWVDDGISSMTEGDETGILEALASDATSLIGNIFAGMLKGYWNTEKSPELTSKDTKKFFNNTSACTMAKNKAKGYALDPSQNYNLVAKHGPKGAKREGVKISNATSDCGTHNTYADTAVWMTSVLNEEKNAPSKVKNAIISSRSDVERISDDYKCKDMSHNR